MRRVRRSLALATLLLVLAGCGGDEGSASSGAADASAGPTPCDLVTEQTRLRIVQSSGTRAGEGHDIAGLFPGDEHFLSCEVVPQMVFVAVRAYDDQRSLEAVLDPYQGAAATPVDGVGDQAFRTTNSYGGTRVLARAGEHTVLVDSHLDARGREVLAEVMEQAAGEMLDRLGEQDIAAIEVADPCPSATDEVVTGQIGETVVARGNEAQGAAYCSYASRDRLLRLGGGRANPGMVSMYQGDATTEPFQVDGQPAYLDDDELTLVQARDCVFYARTTPLGWVRAEQRSDAEMKRVLSGLVTEARDRIGCP